MISFQTPHLFNRLVPSGKYIKTYCEQANRQNFHVWNSHRQHVSDLYSDKVSEENQGALGMGARGQDRLTESSGSLNDV